MRVLYLCHRIPYPPDKGDKIRAFRQVKAIASCHEVDVFTFADDPADLSHRSTLLEHCNRLTVVSLNPRFARLRSLPFLFTRKPLTLPYFYSAELAGKIRQASCQRSYDRVFVYCSAMAQYAEALDLPVITDLVDVDSDKWTQYSTFASWPFSTVYSREGRALREYERRVCERSDCVIVTTDREARLARQISGAPVHVIPNGIDGEHFAPPVTTPPIVHPTIGFIGDMSYFPNEEAVTYFARRVLPLVRQSLPAARFLIVGRSPSRRIQQLRYQEGIDVTGFVPDVRVWMAKMHVSVAPFSIAAGIQNKILEAMAFGLPVVATSKAVQGLSADTARAVDVADNSGDIAAKIIRFVQNPKFARATGAEGRRRVVAEYDWERSSRRLLQVLEKPDVSEMQAASFASVSS
jgi:polysaccharide biosynthesis protein PslH